MPIQSKSVCCYPGCSTLTVRGKCDKHRRDTSRPKSKDRGYDHHWTRLRNAYIRQNPICQIQEVCAGDAAVEVDHIMSIANGGERLDQDNLQSTCKRCHSWKTRTIDVQDSQNSSF